LFQIAIKELHYFKIYNRWAIVLKQNEQIVGTEDLGYSSTKTGNVWIAEGMVQMNYLCAEKDEYAGEIIFVLELYGRITFIGLLL